MINISLTLDTPVSVFTSHRRVAPLLPTDLLARMRQADPSITLADWLNEGDLNPAADSIQEFLRAANLFASLDEEGDDHSLLLWETPPLYQPESMGRPYMDLYLLDHPAPVVVVVPGGGYMMTAILHEGDEIARAYNARGFHAVVVRYRVAPNRYPVPQMDLIRAIKLVRGHAAEWQIEPDHVAVCGFSAGGHLTASVGALHDAIHIPGDEYDHLSARPDALVLSYAVISFTTYAHEGSVAALLGSDNSAAMRAALSCQNRVDGNYPPSFIWTCAVDESVPIENSKLMAEACRQAGVPHELKMYPGGRHGVGLGIGLEAEPWLAQSAAFLRSIFSGS